LITPGTTTLGELGPAATTTTNSLTRLADEHAHIHADWRFKVRTACKEQRRLAVAPDRTQQ
jgi:hypothetical protein